MVASALCRGFSCPSAEQILDPPSSQEIPEGPSLADPSGKLVLAKMVSQRCCPCQDGPSKVLVLAKVVPQNLGMKEAPVFQDLFPRVVPSPEIFPAPNSHSRGDLEALTWNCWSWCIPWAQIPAYQVFPWILGSPPSASGCPPSVPSPPGKGRERLPGLPKNR